MQNYAYEAINKSGQIITGNIKADGEGEVVDRLKRMDARVIDIKPDKKEQRIAFLKKSKKVKLGDISLFSRQFASMIDAGIPITRSLYTLSSQSENPTLKAAIKDIAANVEGGMALSDAMEAYPDIFSSLYIGMVKAGETSGALGEMLERLSDQLQKEKSLNDNVRSATSYPMMVLLFSFMMFFGMLYFLVPLFKDFFPPDMELPALTRGVMSMSNSLRQYWYIWIFSIVAVVTGIKAYRKSPVGKKRWEQMRLRMPGFGPLYHRTIIARFSRTFATLLDSGIPVVQALNQAGLSSGSIIIQEGVMDAANYIQEGKNISQPLGQHAVFPPMMIQMMAVGEETGNLPNLLKRIAEFYEDEVVTMAKNLTSIIEPLMLIIVGVLIGTILISLYMPIFTAVTQIGG